MGVIWAVLLGALAGLVAAVPFAILCLVCEARIRVRFPAD
jgi:hypothetical protein